MKNSFLFLILLTIYFSSCEKIDKFTQFRMNYSTEVTVPANLSINLPVDLLTPDMETNAEGQFSANNTNVDLVQLINLESIEIEVISPSGADFSFLKSAEIYLNAEGLSEIKIASIDEVPEDVGSTITIEGSENNLKEYIVKDKFSLRVATVTDELLTQDHSFEVNSTFFVDALVL